MIIYVICVIALVILMWIYNEGIQKDYEEFISYLSDEIAERINEK